MGNIVLVKKMLQGSNVPSTKMFDLEDVIKNEIVRAVFRKFAGETGQYHDENIGLEEIFDDFEKQENQNQEENWKLNMIKELNELHTAGVSNPDYFTQDLKETRFEKYFRVVVKGASEGEEYYRNQYSKFFIMYSYIKPFYDEISETKDDFFKTLADELEGTDDGGMTTYSFESGITLTFTLLDQLKQSAPQILETALHNIYTAMIKVKTGMLEPNNFKFYAREEILNKHRDYLVALIEDETTSQTVRDMSIKLIIIIGNLRSSGEDYLMAYNLIKHHNLTVNLDSELSLNSFFQSGSSNKGAKEIFKLDTKGSKEIELMTGLGNDPSRYNFTTLTFDEKFLYLFNQNNGLYKYGLKTTQTTKSGLKYADQCSSNNNSNVLLSLKNKLYVRDHTENDRPFRLYDTRSLEEKDDADFNSKLTSTARRVDNINADRILECTDHSSHSDALNSGELDHARSLGKTPIFTDGDLIYVISTHTPVYSKASSLEVEWEVEGYDPDTWSCKFFRRLRMRPEEDKDWSNERSTQINEDTEIIKQYMGEYHILNNVYATNGKYLTVAINDYMYFFDMETGIRLSDKINIPNNLNGYDYHTNSFWHYKTDSDKIAFNNFKVEGFKTKSEMNNENSCDIQDFIKNRTKSVIEEQKDSNRIKARSIEGFLRNLSDKSQKNVGQHEIKHNHDTSQSCYLIMYTMNKGCETIDNTISKMDALYPDLVKEKLKYQSELFRSTLSVTMSSTFVGELINTLEQFTEFLGCTMSDNNVLSQYQFLWMSKLCLRLIYILDRLKLQLSQIVSDDKISSRFVEFVTKTWAKIVDPGLDSSQFEAVNCKDEVDTIWHECVVEWRAIQNVLINITSESSDDITSKINDLAKALNDDVVHPSHRMFLQYLSGSDSMKKIFEGNKTEVLDSLFVIFEILCEKKSKMLTTKISQLNLNSENNDVEYTDLEIVGDEFIYTFANRILIMIYSIQASLSKAIDSDQKKKIENLREKSEYNKNYYSRVFNKLSECSRLIFDASAETTKAMFAEADNLYDSDDANKDNEIIQKANTDIKNKISQYHEALYSLAHDHNKFLQFIHIYVACYASDKSHKMTKNLNNMCRRTVEILKSYGSYCEVNSSKIEMNDTTNVLRHNLSKDLMKFLIWSLSKIAHSFIKSKEPEKKDNREYELLMKSKLLSGGIENRFLSTFSKETCQTIENLAAITGDDRLHKYLNKSEKIDEDEIYEAIVHQGQNQGVDNLLKLLQWNLLRRNPAAKVGGEEGMAVQRCAFASMLSLNQHDSSCSYTNFVMMIDQMEMSMDEIEGTNENQINKALMNEINQLENIDSIIARWEMASKMRPWLQEKRMNVSNTLKKKADAELKRKVDENKVKQEENEKKAEEEEKDHKTAEDGEETIITGVADNTPKIDEEELKKKEADQMRIIVNKVIEKADLLIKLWTPSSWDMTDTSKRNIRAIDGYKEDKDDDKNMTLAQKLQRIKSIQESKGTITSYETLNNKEVFSTCASSVLAWLQCSITARQIMDGIEQKYISAMNRYCGLKIMGEVSQCYMNDEGMTSCFNWFCSSLRKNINVLAHYSDGLVGMGDYLLDRCRVSFFEIYSGIVKQLKKTTNKDTIEFLLNCTQWRIGATDHQYILKSGIIDTLKEGNGDHRPEKNPIKFCWGHKVLYRTNETQSTLSHIILEALEFIMMACFSRVLGQDEDKDAGMKKGASGVAKIQQAYSVVNTNITEVLMATSFEIIFIQLSRYSKFVEKFDPIDWKLYVNERNKMRVTNKDLDLEEDRVFEDEKSPEDFTKEKEAEEKEIAEEEQRLVEEGGDRDKIKEMIDRQTKKEMEKIHTLYDEKVVLKLLRLIEVFTSIAQNNDKIHGFVILVTRPSQILALVKLLLNCQSRHGLVILKIFSNLIKIGISKSVFDEAFAEYKKSDIGSKLFGIGTKVQFEDFPFLQFCYNLLYKIRVNQWNSGEFESYGNYNISWGIARLLKSILRTDVQPKWKEKLEAVMDDFLDDTSSYPIEEIDIILSLFEGGEFEGLNTGSYGKDKHGSKLTVVGFVKKWYDLTIPDGADVGTNFEIQEVSQDLDSKEKYLLAILFDEKHPERSDMILSVPDEITIIPKLLMGSHEFLLKKDRLNQFLKALEIDIKPDMTDPISLTKRCVGMKIIVEHIMTFGERFAELFDEEFRNKLINLLLKECSTADNKTDNLKCDWYEQRLYALKKYATENQVGLRLNESKSIMFTGKHLGISTKVPKSDEMYYESIKIASAMNYGFITQKLHYKLIDSEKVLETPHKNDHVAIMNSDDINTPEKLTEVFQHVDIVVTSDLDLKDMHDKLVLAGDNRIAYFKSVVLLNHNKFVKLQKTLHIGPRIKHVSSNESEYEQLCSEIQTFLKLSREQIDDIWKGKENADHFEKVKLLTDWAKKNSASEDEKDEKKKEDKKSQENEENVEYNSKGYENWFGLFNNDQMRTNMNDLANYAGNNYSTDVVDEQKTGDLFSKVYSVKANAIITEYSKTLGSLYKQLCRKNISSFFSRIPLDTLLDIILADEENFDLFIKYLQIKGNEAVNDKNSSGNTVAYNSFLEMMQNIIHISATNEKYSNLNSIILKKVLIQGTSSVVRRALKDKTKKISAMFKTDADAVKGLNTFLVPNIIKFLQDEAPKLIYDNEDDYMNLITWLLMIPMTFRDDKDFAKSIYMSIYKLISNVVNYSDKYSTTIKSKILGFRLLKDILDKVNFNLSITDYNCFTNEQKLLFEIFLLIRQLEDFNKEIGSIFTYPDKVLDIEKCKIVLKEMKKFDMIAYLNYYNNELTDDEKATKMIEETLHNRYKGKTCAKFEYPGIKKMSIKIHEDTVLEGTSSIGFSTDPEGKNVIKKISKLNLDKNETEFDLNCGTFYTHYPYNPPRIMSWGYGYDYRLGNYDSGTTTTPVEFKDFTKPLKKLFCRSGFSIALGEDNLVYWVGYRSDWGGYKYTMDRYTGTLPEEPIIELKVASNNVAVLTDDHKIYICGYESNYLMDGSGHNHFWYKPRPDEETEKVTEWDLGYYYMVYWTDNGKCYGAGNDFMKGIDLECTNKDFVEIKFDEGIVPKRPICNNLYETYKPCLMFVDNNGKSELWSAGYSSYGLLGQGDGRNEMRKFQKMDYDSETITFVDASIKYYAGMARTDDGRLFAWGSNSSGQCGLPNRNNNYFTPTEIPFFKDYFTHEFNLGDYHSMVCASPRDNMEKRQIFLIGDIKGLSDLSGKNSDGIFHFKMLDDCNYTWMECGESTFFLNFEGENTATENLGVHDGYTCEVTGESPIVGTMHFWKSSDSTWHFVSKDGFNKLNEESKEIPDICYATKYPINDIQGKEWPEVMSSNVLKDENHDSYPQYISVNSHGDIKLEKATLSQSDIFKHTSKDINPLIYYRIARPLKDGVNLPCLNLSSYHVDSEVYGFKIEVSPNYTYQKNDKIISLQKDKYNKVVKNINKLGEKHDPELLEAIESYINKNSTDFLNYPNTEIDAADLTFISKELKNMKPADIQPRINAFIEFNKNFLQTIPFVILDEELIKAVTDGKTEIKGETLSIMFMICKSFAFKSIKNSYIKKVADSLGTNYDEPTAEINRMLIRHKRDKGKIDDKGEWSTFGTVYKVCKNSKYENLKKQNSSYKAWRANFLGEGSIDAGGPFRESVENMVDEIQSSWLPLLIPTQNHKNDHGLNKDCWTINPASTSPHHLEMFKFLGALIGMAFRSGHVMDLKFPPMFWMRLIGDPITLDSLAGSDAYAVQAIRDLEKNKDSIPPDMFEDTMDLTFTTQLSNGETVPICPGGEKRKVTYNDIDEYHRLVLKTRAEEGSRQMAALKKGFEIIFPTSILGILSWKDVEERVRGPNEISVDALKSITEYSSCSADNEYVLRFWRVFEEFTNEERSKFLKFVWGRARLPPIDRLKDQNFKLYLMDSYKFTNHDIHFPESHTCFFQLDLPRYTNDEACKAKILYAITSCGEIDTDGSSYSISNPEGDWDD